jgi:hypothetical protein
LIRSAAVSGVPRALSVSKISWGVLLGPKIDDHQLQRAGDDGREHLGAHRELGQPLLTQPPLDLLTEETMTSGEQAAAVLESRIVDRRIGPHDLVVAGTVAVGVPELEQLVVILDIVGRVVRQLLQPTREIILSPRLQHRSRRVHQQLQGRQPLLAIDDEPGLEGTRLVVLRLEHHSAQEMGGRTGEVAETQLGHAAHVLPQRHPLVLLIPYVRTLEQRNYQVLRQVENLQRRAHNSLHKPSFDRHRLLTTP